MTRQSRVWTGLVMMAALFAGCSDDATATTEPDAGPDVAPVRTEPLSKFIPTATGTCPGFADGDGCTKDDVSLICIFHPEGVEKPRKVRVWVDESADDKDRPVVFFWHGLGGNATHAVTDIYGLGTKTSGDIVDSGAILIALEKEEGRSVGLTTLPWLAALGAGKQDDFTIMDEVLACAGEKYTLDHSRIYSTGMSAGALQTGQVTVKRSGYIASAVLFSGGIDGKPELQDPDNKLPVAVFYGGPQDIVSPVKFELEAMNARKWLKEHDQFSILCNHGKQHTLPVVAAAAGWQFLQDHPFGTVPSPYAKGVPSDFPADYCEL